MTGSEMVTTVSTGENDNNPAPIKVAELLKWLNLHLKRAGLDAEEYDFSSCWKYDNPDGTIPKNARWLIAFAVEGSNEGYYVHVGAILSEPDNPEPVRPYHEFGIAKMYSPENAYAIAKEAQRFLTAARWN